MAIRVDLTGLESGKGLEILSMVYSNCDPEYIQLKIMVNILLIRTRRYGS